MVSAPGLLTRLAAPYRAGLTGLDPRVHWLVSAYFVSIAARMSLVTFLGIYFTRERGIPIEVVGVAYLLENLVTAVVGPFGGALSDRVGRRPVMLVGLVGTAVALPAFLLIGSPIALFAWSGLIGAMNGLFRPASMSFLIDLAPANRRQAVLGLNYTALSLGYTLGVAPAGYVATLGYGWLALGTALGYGVVVAIVALRLRGPVPHEAGAEAPKSFLADALRAPRDPAFLALAVPGLLFPIGIGLVSTTLPIFGVDSGISEATLGLVLASSGIVLVALSVPGAALVERFGVLRSLPLGVPLVAGAYLVFAASPTAAGMLVGLTLFTLGEVVYSTAIPTAVAALAPRGARGAYQGAWGMVFSLGAGAALYLSGVAESAVGWRWTWVAFALGTAAAGVAMALLVPSLRRVSRAREAAAAVAGAAAAEASTSERRAPLP